MSATISVIDADFKDVGWIFPNEPYTAEDPRRFGNKVISIWKHSDNRPFEHLTPGQWLRTEFYMIYDNEIYAPERNGPMLLNIDFSFTQRFEQEAFADLTLEANGEIHSANTRGNNIDVLVGGATSAKDFATAAWGTGSIHLAAAAASAGWIWGVLTHDAQRNQRIELSGRVQGDIVGTITASTPLSNNSMYIAGTQGDVPEHRTAQKCRSTKLGVLWFGETDPRPDVVSYVVERCIGRQSRRPPIGELLLGFPIIGKRSCGPHGVLDRWLGNAGSLESPFPWIELRDQRITLETTYNVSYSRARAWLGYFETRAADPAFSYCDILYPADGASAKACRIGPNSILQVQEDNRPIRLYPQMSSCMDPQSNGSPRPGTDIFNACVGDDKSNTVITDQYGNNRRFRVYLRWSAIIYAEQMSNGVVINRYYHLFTYALDVTDKLSFTGTEAEHGDERDPCHVNIPYCLR